MSRYFNISIIGIFLVLTGVFYALKTYAPDYRFNVLMTGNILVALLCFITYYIVKRQISSRPEAFVRGVYAGTFLKLFVCMIAFLVYVLISKPDIHKPTLFVLMGIYAIYTIVETGILSRMAKGAK